MDSIVPPKKSTEDLHPYLRPKPYMVQNLASENHSWNMQVPQIPTFHSIFKSPQIKQN